MEEPDRPAASPCLLAYSGSKPSSTTREYFRGGSRFSPRHHDLPNDLSTVAAGSGRLVIAHTAAVGPADVRVDEKVLFANIANGEALTVTVPAGTYKVDIVPNATSGPVVFGPATLPVAETALTRVFAIGVAATNSMDAVVQLLPLGVRGTGATPSAVNAGDGGQAADLATGAQGQSDNRELIALGAIVLLGAALLVEALRRERSPRTGLAL